MEAEPADVDSQSGATSGFESSDDVVMNPYINRLQVTVVSGQSPIDTQSATELVLMAHSVSVDTNWLEVEIEKYLRSFPGEYAPFSAVDITRKTTNWGAAGAVLEALVNFAAPAVVGGVIGNAAYDLLKTLARRVKDKVGNHGGRYEIDASEAVRQARQMIYNRRSVPPDLLRLVRTEENILDNIVVVEFVDHHDRTYSAEVHWMPKGIVVAKLSYGELSK